MIIKWLRNNVAAAGILTVLRLYLGWQWMTAGWGKIKGGDFDSAGFLQGAVAKASGDHPAVQGWWANFLEGFAIPNAEFFNFLVPWGEFLVGIALLIGLFTQFAAVMGAVMNFAFLFSGTVSTNAQMVLLTIFIVIAASNAGKIGLDYYILPEIRSWFKKEVSPAKINEIV